ncbi:MAG: hypothetical protein AB8E15_03670 [Bdellovibrionales bacterium]
MSNTLILEPGGYFLDLIEEAYSRVSIRPEPQVKKYLSQLLVHYVKSDNLFLLDEDEGRFKQPTLAEMYFKAIESPKEDRRNWLKRLGDTSLYIAGIFGDSLQRKMNDLDYYVDMGGTAYSHLATEVEGSETATIYREISKNFTSYLDIYTYISQTTLSTDNKNLLRLYENYVRTGSEIAKQHLLDEGILTLDNIDDKKVSQ